MTTDICSGCISCMTLRNRAVVFITVLIICSINIHLVQSHADNKDNSKHDKKQNEGISSDNKGTENIDTDNSKIIKNDLHDVTSNQHESVDKKVETSDDSLNAHGKDLPFEQNIQDEMSEKKIIAHSNENEETNPVKQGKSPTAQTQKLSDHKVHVHTDNQQNSHQQSNEHHKQNIQQTHTIHTEKSSQQNTPHSQPVSPEHQTHPNHKQSEKTGQTQYTSQRQPPPHTNQQDQKQPQHQSNNKEHETEQEQKPVDTQESSIIKHEESQTNEETQSSHHSINTQQTHTAQAELNQQQQQQTESKIMKQQPQQEQIHQQDKQQQQQQQQQKIESETQPQQMEKKVKDENEEAWIKKVKDVISKPPQEVEIQYTAVEVQNDDIKKAEVADLDERKVKVDVDSKIDEDLEKIREFWKKQMKEEELEEEEEEEDENIEEWSKVEDKKTVVDKRKFNVLTDDDSHDEKEEKDEDDDDFGDDDDDDEEESNDESFEDKILEIHGRQYEKVDIGERKRKKISQKAGKNSESVSELGSSNKFDADTDSNSEKLTDDNAGIEDSSSFPFEEFPEPFDRSKLNMDDVAGIYTNVEDNVKETMIVYKPDEFGYAKLEKYIQTVYDTHITTDYEEYFEHLPERVTHKHILDQYENRQQTSGGVESNKEVESEEIELSQEEIQAIEYFEKGEALVNESHGKDQEQAHEYFKLAADLNHTKALEYVGFANMFGDYLPHNLSKANEIFEDLSSRGVPRGQLGLGFMHATGIGKNSSQAKGLIYLTFSALGGDPLAQMSLGYRYLSGIGVEMKCETALTYYKKVATTVADAVKMSGGPVIQRVRLQEEAESQGSGGQSALLDDDLLQYYHFLADKGDVQAQVVLGQLYYQGGRGVGINHERAHHYFLMAAESHNANALGYLGKMYSEGSPAVEQNNKTAFQYFKNAADKGNPIGQTGLGLLYLYGKGIDKDFSKAYRYFTLSADQGWVEGQLQLGIMYMTGQGVKRDYKMAVKYFNLASQGGHVLAFHHLATMHASGIGVLRNCHTAVELFKNVAERGKWAEMLMDAHSLYKEGHVYQALLKYTFIAELGYEVAQSNVAYLLDQGEVGVFTESENYQRALLQYTRAAAQGSTVARVKMGDYHYYGYGTEIDYESAATHYRVATEQQHNAQAMFNLGYMHEQGLGLKQDIHLAKRFYDMAAETSNDAHVPVFLALIKLGLFHGVDIFNKEFEGYHSLFRRLDVRYLFGPDWDIYLITFFSLILGLVVLLRRVR